MKINGLYLIILSFIVIAACQNNKKNLPEKLVTVEFTVEGMNSRACEQAIIDNVNTLEGIEGVMTMHSKGKATVYFDINRINTKEIITKIEEKGYKVVDHKQYDY